MRGFLTKLQRRYADFHTGSVPAFTDVSSPELNDLLSALRQKFIMPAHLSKEQRRLIYKEKHKNVLLTEPVTATISGESFTLQHISKTKDVPNVYHALFDAIELMKEKKDWDNLPNLLEGLKHGGLRTQKLLLKQKVVGKATRAGRQEVILECLRRAADTGIVLEESEFVAKVMLSMHYKAQNSDWDKHETAKALSWAEMVVALLEDPKHAGNRKLDGKKDPRVQPEVTGILLELAAVRAVKHLGSRDSNGKVAEYAMRFLGTPLELKEPENEYVLNPWLLSHIPILHGMYEALKVLDPSSVVAARLKTKSEELDACVSVYRNMLSEVAGAKERPRVGLKMFEKLLG